MKNDLTSRSAAELQARLREAASARNAIILQRFFKTGPGEYGEGDQFLGVKVPSIRRLVRVSDAVPFRQVLELLKSPFHEERLLALLILVRRFERGDDLLRERIYACYLRSTRWISNWDLVDLSAPNIVGVWLVERPRGVLEDLAGSANLWERRIAVLATLAFIRRDDFNDTVRLCRRLLRDRHDLMHKACGWMLREVGKRDRSVLEDFLERHGASMPRTMLRYAIERLPETERRRWLQR